MKKLHLLLEYKYLVAIIYTVALFCDRLDLTIVNIALPTLADYFHLPIEETSWISNSFLLALGVSIPLSSWLGAKYGLKKIFLIALSLFGLTSLLCAFSPNVYSMIALRFLQGIGGGLLTPVGMTMVYRAFEPAEYVSITSFIFIPVLIAPAAAPALGGILLTIASWPWLFIIVVPFCLITFIAALFILKEHKEPVMPPIDWLGLLLATASLTLLLAALALISKTGLTLSTTTCWLAAVIAIILFISFEAKQTHPFIDLTFFKNKSFLQANLIQLTFQICLTSSFFLIGLYLQIAVKMSALHTGLIIGMQALGAMCSNRYSVKLFRRFGPARPIILGLIGVAFISPLILTVSAPQQILLGCGLLFIRGLFTGLCGAPLQTMGLITFSKQTINQASAVFTACRQVSISLGIAIFSLFIAYGLQAFNVRILDLAHPAPLHKAFTMAFLFMPIAALAGIAIALTIERKKEFCKMPVD